MAKARARKSERERDTERLLVAVVDLTADWLADHHHAARLALGAGWRKRVDAIRRGSVAKGRAA